VNDITNDDSASEGAKENLNE